MTGSRLVDVNAGLDGLKDFQRATVDHAFHRLFVAPDSTSRFLVADEVGLGKTMVARGVVAKAVERLAETGVESIDIVYICSNVDIARQNVSRLAAATGEVPAISSRLTLLPAELRRLESRRLSTIALTPGTSFDLKSAMGVAEERALLYVLLRRVWGFGKSVGPMNVLQGGVRDRSWWRGRLREFDSDDLSDKIAANFAEALRVEDTRREEAGKRTLRERFDELSDVYRRRQPDRVLGNYRRDRSRLIAQLRAELAATCVEELEPDLVILDEFQRFKHLMSGESDAAQLARLLFGWKAVDRNEHARVLLLSATPYRMYTVRDDGQDDDHHADFLATVEFLMNGSGGTDDLRRLLSDYRAELYSAEPQHPDRLLEIQDAIGKLLSRVMSRTERLVVSGAHDGMVTPRLRTAPPNAKDLRQFLFIQDIAAELDERDVTELWKSAPYLLSFLDGYKLRSRFDAVVKNPAESGQLAELIRNDGKALLEERAIRAFEPLDPGNPRLRELARDVIDSGAWRMLWIPPSLPYTQLAGAYGDPELAGFTKRLVFSAWRAVPRAAAGILSYLAERELTRRVDPSARNLPEDRRTRGNRLRFTREGERLTGMPVVALLYPSPRLATELDPLDFVREHGPGRTGDELVEWARERAQRILGELPPGALSGPPDERWYWAAPLMLDEDSGWWMQSDLERAWSGRDPRKEDEGRGWRDHVELARSAVERDLDLGRRPDDLDTVLALQGLAAPGVVGLRALTRATGADPTDIAVRNAAGHLAWGLRSLFNSPEATLLLRFEGREPLWRDVLRHGVDGGLQAVMDEYAHVLVESLGVLNRPPAEAAEEIAKEIDSALALRASRSMFSDISVDDEGIDVQRRTLHTSFAARFGEEEATLRSGEVPTRPSQLRSAFNSPFWPFVLVSTSVGQEGLDFHPYAHVVVHWNLPTNPIDLEQREGRVHRYKGHAVRKNVARQHGEAALLDSDPWNKAFELAAADRAPGDGDLVPYWIYPLDGGAKIERQVLALPLSREVGRLEVLRSSLAVYRLAFGQARQDDLIAHLIDRLGAKRATALAERLRIDLRPPARQSAMSGPVGEGSLHRLSGRPFESEQRLRS